jgi:hypothetical protein
MKAIMMVTSSCEVKSNFRHHEVKFPSGLRIVTVIDSNLKFKPEAHFQNGARVEQVISRCPSQLRSDISDSVFLNRWITVDLNVAIQLVELQNLLSI